MLLEVCPLRWRQLLFLSPLLSSLLLLPLVAAQNETQTIVPSFVCTDQLLEECMPCRDEFIAAAPDDSYTCSLPGLSSLTPGMYKGISANYLSFVTETSSPNLPIRAQEFMACTGGTIVFAEAENVWEDPIADLGSKTSVGLELYDGYFMSYSHFPEASALGLAEHLNDRIGAANARLKWEDVYPKVRRMSEYRSNGETNVDFLMYDGDFFVPIIRLDLLERHNKSLPNTWPEVVELAKFFNGTDLNDDGIEDDFGFCHFPRLGAGYWDWWWAEAVYSTWATFDQTQGVDEGFFFDEETMEPRIDGNLGFSKAAEIWKELWNNGADGCITDHFVTGRCAIGFGPPGCWKRIFLNRPDGVSRKDNVTGETIWRPTFKNGDYAEPYRFKPFGSTEVVDRETGTLVPCTRERCPKAEVIPPNGHMTIGDRANVTQPSPLQGRLINRSPFYWSGGLGTLIRASADEEKKDLLWDFFVYTNSAETSVYDVANYVSWLDSWRTSQLFPGNNFLDAGWSYEAYSEHAFVMQWALSAESNGAMNLRLPGLVEYTRDSVGKHMSQYIQDDISLSQLATNINTDWIEITDARGKLDQLTIYRSSLNFDSLSPFMLCELHRTDMDEIDPSVCRVFDETNTNTVLVAALVPSLMVLLVLGSLAFLFVRQKNIDSVWSIKREELVFHEPPEILGRGTFGLVLLAEYRGTQVAVKRVIPPKEERGHQGTPKNAGRRSSYGGSLLDSIQEDLANSKSSDRDLENPHLSSAGLTSLRLSSKGTQARCPEESSTSNPGLETYHRGLETDRRISIINSNSASSSMQKNRMHRKARTDFILEMRQLNKLRHPNITTTMGAVLTRGEEPMLVMEYMQNGSLYDAIRDDTINLNSHEDILIIIQDVAHGLRYLHSANPQVIHGDLKSKNVLIDVNGRAKVADFGLSVKTKLKARGTPYFMAPELLSGQSTNTSMSDIYAFGMLLYEAYARKSPYEGENYEEVLRLVCDPTVSKRPPVPSLCPPTIVGLLKDCLQHNPNDRPTAKDVDAMLQAEGTVQGRVIRIEALNKELADSNERISLEQATQLGHFASMSHEIRTPLNCIIGISSLLEEDSNLDVAQRDSVKMMVASGKLLKQVVDDVLDFSKFISGNAEIDIKRTNLQDTMANIITSMMLSPVTERKQISIRTFFDPLLPQYVETDDRRLQQIMYNLLSNAVKFSKENSNVDLSISVENPQETQRPALHICVKDYGKGIDSSEFEKIFQPFAQTESGMTNVDGGTGLGLAITKQLVEALGGCIAVDSSIGEWTLFSMQFPLTVSKVDKTAMKARLKGCGVWLLSDLESEVQCATSTCDYFNLKHRRCGSMKELGEQLHSSRASRPQICLIQDNLYDKSAYEIISQKAKTVLVSFGPDGRIKEAQAHYQSLGLVFPSVLMQEFDSLSNIRRPVRRVMAQNGVGEETDNATFEGLNILVAEDNIVNQKVIKRLLQRLGITKVKIAENGQVAVDCEAAECFDIVFMDMQMPVMGGIEACKRIVARSKSPPKIVFLSAHVMHEYKTMCLENGATDYMTKPITLEDLRKKLEFLVSMPESDRPECSG